MAWGGRFHLPRNPTRMDKRLYAATVFCGLGLAAAQLFVLPRLLSPSEFGIVIIAISLTQAGFGMGDFALSFASQSTRLDGYRRAALRESALSLATLVTVTGALGIVVSTKLVPSSQIRISLALGVLTVLVLEGSVQRARSCEQAGDERAAALENFCWQNAPKAGLLIGAAVGRSPISCLAGGLLSSLVVGRPALPRLSYRVFSVLKEWRVWAPALVSVTAVFAVTWGDTYMVASQLGFAAAAGYEATYRVMSSVTYLFQPWNSILLARLNVGDSGALRPVLLRSLALTVFGLGIVTSIMYTVADSLFPGLPLSFGALGPLAVLFLLSNVTGLLGYALIARGKFGANVAANGAALLVAVAGHGLFTRNGGATTAATVSACSVAAASVVLCIALRTSMRESHGDALESDAA